MSRESTQTISAMEALQARIADLEQQVTTLTNQLTETTDALRMFKALVENTPDSVSFANLEGQFMYVNPSFQQSIGNTVAIGKPVAAVLAETSQPQLPQIIERIMSHGTWEGIVEQQRYDGSTFIGYGSAFLVTDEQGVALGMGAIFRDITEQMQRDVDLHTFQTLVEHAPDGITIVGLDGILTYANPSFKALIGYGEQTIGMHMLDFRPEEVRAEIPAIMHHLHEHGVWRGRQLYRQKCGDIVAVQVSAFIIPDEQGQPRVLMGIHRDITEQERQAQAHEALQQELIQAQQSAIRELSSPLLPLTDTVVVLPLIGSMDRRRAQQVIETLLEGIVHHGAVTALVDITGVSVVDTQVAQTLVQTAHAIKLLGAQMILTGIKPNVAQTIIHLGVELDGIITYSTLQAGIAAVLSSTN